MAIGTKLIGVGYELLWDFPGASVVKNLPAMW